MSERAGPGWPASLRRRGVPAVLWWHGLTAVAVVASANVRAATTIQVVAPAEGAEVPANVKTWVYAESGEGPALTVTVDQEGDERTLNSDIPNCCFSYAIRLGPLEQGPVAVTLTPQDGSDAVTVGYSVSGEEDTSPPTIGPPRLSFERGSFIIAHAEIVDAADDWGVVAVVPEFNSNRDGFQIPGVPAPPATWEAEHTLVGPDQLAAGGVGFFDDEHTEACARFTAIDMGGNRAMSETVCVPLRDRTLSEWLQDEGRALLCSCGNVRRGAPFGAAATLIVPIALFRRRGRPISRSIAHA